MGLDEREWGFDHGTWSVLKPMFPAAEIRWCSSVSTTGARRRITSRSASS
jgi:aromatic ring-opening dioxygenase catalytic subunit (LigB family)